MHAVAFLVQLLEAPDNVHMVAFLRYIFFKNVLY
jgi:hypothetical protein